MVLVFCAWYIGMKGLPWTPGNKSETKGALCFTWKKTLQNGVFSFISLLKRPDGYEPFGFDPKSCRLAKQYHPVSMTASEFFFAVRLCFFVKLPSHLALLGWLRPYLPSLFMASKASFAPKSHAICCQVDLLPSTAVVGAHIGLWCPVAYGFSDSWKSPGTQGQAAGGCGSRPGQGALSADQWGLWEVLRLLGEGGGRGQVGMMAEPRGIKGSTNKKGKPKKEGDF